MENKEVTSSANVGQSLNNDSIFMHYVGERTQQIAAKIQLVFGKKRTFEKLLQS